MAGAAAGRKPGDAKNAENRNNVSRGDAKNAEGLSGQATARLPAASMVPVIPIFEASPGRVPGRHSLPAFDALRVLRVFA